VCLEFGAVGALILNWRSLGNLGGSDSRGDERGAVSFSSFREQDVFLQNQIRTMKVSELCADKSHCVGSRGIVHPFVYSSRMQGVMREPNAVIVIHL
jgi:hypothetical protein